MPWLTGGFAGAILTFILNRRLERKRQARLSIVVSDIDYSLPSHQSAFAGLRVSYNGDPYDKLRYYQFRVLNVSQRTVCPVPFIFLFAKDASILDQSIESGPLKLNVECSREAKEENGIRCEIQAFKPGDYLQFNFLLSSTEGIKWFFRGADDVDIIATDRTSEVTEDGDFRDLVAAASFYVLLGALPLFAGIFQSAVVLFAGTIIRRMILRHRSSNKNQMAPASIQIHNTNYSVRDASHKVQISGS